MERKFCPIINNTCQKEQCAMYDVLNDQCGVLTIGVKLYDISHTMREHLDIYNNFANPEKEPK